VLWKSVKPWRKAATDRFENPPHFAKRHAELAKHPASSKYAPGGYRGNSREILWD